MYYKHREWLEEVSSDITLDNQLEVLRRQKNFYRTEVCHLEYECFRLYGLYSQARLALGRAKLAYQKTDYALACQDGRLTIIDEIRLEDEKMKNIQSILSKMTNDERAKLIDELRGTEFEGEND
jgi:hypothetical protein